MQVQKRRIYAITNVLEGIGLIEKKLENRIHWNCRYSVRSNQAQFHSSFSFGRVDLANQFEQGTHNSVEICKIKLESLVIML
ncbi:hypothetical protein ACS0TY_020177 [Phlomoides rotata]